MTTDLRFVLDRLIESNGGLLDSLLIEHRVTCSNRADCPTEKWVADSQEAVRQLLADNADRARTLRTCEQDNLRQSAEADKFFKQAQDAIEWIGVVRDELVIAGFPAGDRDVALANIRALIRLTGPHTGSPGAPGRPQTGGSSADQ